MRKLWAIDGTSFSPGQFKAKLARFAPHFSGFNQHDSQVSKFLVFLKDMDVFSMVGNVLSHLILLPFSRSESISLNLRVMLLATVLILSIIYNARIL